MYNLQYLQYVQGVLSVQAL